MNEPKEGEKFRLYCYEKECKKYIILTMENTSFGYAISRIHGRIDLRNQVWYCPKHRKIYVFGRDG